MGKDIRLIVVLIAFVIGMIQLIKII